MEDCPCVTDQEMYDQDSRICRHCPWYLVIGALKGVEFELKRQEFMRRLVEQGHLSSDKLIVAAIMKQYGANRRAAELSWRRARRRYRKHV